MTITLKQNQSADNRINKVFSSTTKNYDVYLLEETNVINPVFVLVAALKDVEKFNYIDAPEFARKYFIRDIVSIDGERVAVHAAVDVLTSFASDIYSAQVLTGRSSKNINALIPDTKLKNSVRGIPQIKTFTGGEWLPTLTASENGIVVTTFGGGITNG